MRPQRRPQTKGGVVLADGAGRVGSFRAEFDGRHLAAPWLTIEPQNGSRAELLRGGGKLVPVGQGTERIEDALRMRFPEYRVERFDSDRLSSGAAIARLLAEVESGEVKLLVGTQVLAKGHDFAGLQFAGLVDVDQALFGSDFRALERMGQLVTQVAGRVGRGGEPGEVILQTHHPEHPLLKLLVERGYPAFAEALMAERRQFLLPPFANLALLRVEAKTEGEVMAFLRKRLPTETIVTNGAGKIGRASCRERVSSPV